MNSKIENCSVVPKRRGFSSRAVGQFRAGGVGHITAVDEYAKGQTAVISVSSQHMRKLYKCFPRSY
ncbi:Hypothetical protein PHPALM_14271 [Phytophthora palmivora]|uniref:Uncharacterized protein n=1 Tax=Phytophthora palmivora TaxID=4796 RepID=A0A2P4XV63_9STRA|nr:Hypothetical protein PHPALM_14271 [Phytophthora palmivora]